LSQQRFDVLDVGTGSALEVASAAAARGLRVAIVQRRALLLPHEDADAAIA
jgi:pyruvate/2-oxoglutarate dehydrogenase complex dihydrolipoamide dehydrogenase (E3) component